MKKIYWLGLLPVIAFAAITPNMLLNKPVSGDTNYVSKIDTIFNQIDSHDHTAGKGVPIPTGGIGTGAVTQSKIANQAVGTTQLALGSVTTQILSDEAVTYTKLADAAVGIGKVDQDVIGDPHVKPRTVYSGGVTLSSQDTYTYIDAPSSTLTSTTAQTYQLTPLQLIMFGRGKVIELGLSGIPASESAIQAVGTAGTPTAYLRITKNGTNLYSTFCGSTTLTTFCPVGQRIEDPEPGGTDDVMSSVTYKVFLRADGNGQTASLVNVRFTGTMKR